MIGRVNFQRVRCTIAAAIAASAMVLCLVSIGGASVAAATRDAVPPASVLPKASVPVWAIGATWYLVDVPRFANGDKSSDPSGTLDWPTGLSRDAKAPGAAAENAATNYGGDLAGLTRRLAHLTDLGINTLYLRDWKPAPTDRRFADFLKKAHERGFRVVIGAAIGSVRRGTPGAGAAPELDAAAALRWMDPDGDGRPDDGVDGWVVPWSADAPVGEWLRWRKQVKALNPDALIVGDANRDTRSAGASGIFDTVMNHEAGGAIRDFFREATGGKAPAALLEKLSASISGMSIESRLASPVLLSAWSTGTQAVASDGDLAARWRLATVVQHFFLGSPVTYFGDEMGLRGGRGNAGRRVMLWPDLPGTDPVVLKHRDDFASLLQWLHVRRSVDPPLRRGDFRAVLADGERRLLAFARSTVEGEVIVLVNYGAAKHLVTLPVASPGTRVSVVTPFLDPSRMRLFGRKAAASKDRISPKRMAGSRQVISGDGLARLWVDPMSIRVVLSLGE